MIKKLITNQLNTMKEKIETLKDNITDIDVWFSVGKYFAIVALVLISIWGACVWVNFTFKDWVCNKKASAIAYTGEYSWWHKECVYTKGDKKYLLKQIRGITLDGEVEGVE